MRLLVVALLSLFFIGEAIGQEFTPKIVQASKDGKEAFQCAALAAEATPEIKVNASPLAFVAHSKTTTAMEVIVKSLASMPESGGPLASYILAQDTGFFVALAFGEANVAVTKYLDGLAPFDGSSTYEVIRQKRDWAAEAEYQHRNCDLFLR